jgi:hypothetical protein
MIDWEELESPKDAPGAPRNDAAVQANVSHAEPCLRVL